MFPAVVGMRWSSPVSSKVRDHLDQGDDASRGKSAHAPADHLAGSLEPIAGPNGADGAHWMVRRSSLRTAAQTYASIPNE